MHPPERHLSDFEVLGRLDDELSESRAAAVDRHLAECEGCRRRRDVLAEVAEAASAEYRAVVTPDAVAERSRARLESSLARAAEEPGGPWAIAFGGITAASRRAWAGMAVTTAVVLLASLWMRPGPQAVSVDALMAHHGVLPVTAITPGATWDMTAKDLCAGVRHTRPITTSMRAEVVRAYGVEQIPPEQYELDYLITPELGGATDARNLWPQAYASPVWNARVKDGLEQLLPELVCSGQLDLEVAQRDMASDWIAAYKKYFRTDVPLRAHRGPAIDDDDLGAGTYLLADARPTPTVRLTSLTDLR
jgi:hypothetical protein